MDSGSLLLGPSEYHATVGSLQYLLLTRSNIAFAVNKLSQFMHKLSTDRWALIKRLCYLCGIVYEGILLYHDSPLSLHAVSDVDWAGKKDDFSLTSAYIVYLGCNPISWSSKKQRSIACSTTEVEYCYVANTVAELTWVCSLLGEVCSLLRELDVSLPHSPVICCDNIEATNLYSNLVFTLR